ncbi:hypothetical protein qu_278 [Acanthamoeba polyphaga mimivirus]|nr:hypothetical protein [Mimivirus reunion]WMV61613.1 hypothetical protein qu_278 [Mimivirus sp.]WMV62590.1 hypothetical protein qu_278 [Acanthamoeba polyphaga mimivirus]WMV63567.1 hypothetical protein qu_278 [Mimivirus sp.]
MDDQIKEIRQKKHQQYLDHLNGIIPNNQDKQNHIVVPNLINQINPINATNQINPINTTNQRNHVLDKIKFNYAAIRIQRFIRKKMFEPKCINEEEILSIPSIYRLRIDITDMHINEYNEEDIPNDILEYHRIIYKSINFSTDSTLFFRYCFDIRKLYPIRHQQINIFGEYFYLQPDDHKYLNCIWKKVNNITSESIRYLTDFDYHKSLSVDSHKSN